MPPGKSRQRPAVPAPGAATVSGPPSSKIRIYVLTAAFTAITATGAWYGAGLKSDQEAKQERKAVMQATVAERIQQMEDLRTRLLRQKADIQVKVDRLTARAEQASIASSNETG